jgi:hypothetical protein
MQPAAFLFGSFLFRPCEREMNITPQGPPCEREMNITPQGKKEKRRN